MFCQVLFLGFLTSNLGATASRIPSIDETALFSRRDVSIAVAPSTGQLELSSNPNRDIFSSPARARVEYLRWKQSGHKGFEPVNTIFNGVYPVINLTWGNKPQIRGGQQFISFIDTGSSDTWVMASNFQCLNISTRSPLDQSACGFGELYDSSKGLFTNISGEVFSIGYFPENETLQGDMGYAPITMGGLTVPKQEVALVKQAAWTGDGSSSGLLGLGYPAITSATNRTTGDPIQYDPIFTTMVKERIVSDAVFSLALNRVPQGTSVHAPAGLMSIGGLVPASYYQKPFTSVPIEVTNNTGTSELTWYTTTHELVYELRNGTKVSGGVYQSIVDSGTAPNFVPTAAAYNLNAQFVPAAVYNESLGYWTVDCKAKAPYAAFVIGGIEMPMDPRDMIVRSLNGLPGYENVCFSAFADGGDPTETSMIIGEVWQLSYVVAYDQGRGMIHFAKRQPY